MAAQVQLIALFDRYGTLLHIHIEKLGHHRKGFGVAHHLHLRIFFHRPLNIGGMIRLHVVNDQIIRRSAVERFL